MAAVVTVQRLVEAAKERLAAGPEWIEWDGSGSGVDWAWILGALLQLEGRARVYYVLHRRGWWMPLAPSSQPRLAAKPRASTERTHSILRKLALTYLAAAPEPGFLTLP